MTTSRSFGELCPQNLTSAFANRVTPSTLPAVLSAPIPIYMAFYVKRRLDYKPDMTPSYVLTRETEAVREREQEKEKERLKERQRHLAKPPIADTAVKRVV